MSAILLAHQPLGFVVRSGTLLSLLVSQLNATIIIQVEIAQLLR
jgi:hypothetical protein